MVFWDGRYQLQRACMARKQLIAIIFSAVLGAMMGCLAFYITIMWLTAPETLLEWAVQVCSGLTVAIVVFFLSWGHFQDPAKVGQGQ
jgi:ABC-type amino acid transport system permease subunit